MIKRDANYIGYMDSEFNTIKQPNDAGQLLRAFSSHTILTHLSLKRPMAYYILYQFEQK